VAISTGYSWKEVPLRSAVFFFAGVFFLFSSVGFIQDILSLGRQPVLHLVLSTLMSGGFAIIYAYAGTTLRERWYLGVLPAFAVHFFAQHLVAKWLPEPARPETLDAAGLAHLDARLTASGVLVLACVAFGYASFLAFFIREGRRYFRVHAEMQLAHEIHQVLVPPISMRLPDYEVVGFSQPSGEVGGDLVDVVQGPDVWVAYLADVSGHGVAPGVVMGIAKSAARMHLTAGGAPDRLLARLHEVIEPLKKPNMFVTMAYVAGQGGRLQYATAGHPAILHHHAAGAAITELQSPNPPVGMIDPSRFEISSVDCRPGDLLVLVSDGLLEAADKKGREFGLDGVKRVIAQNAGRPLDEVRAALFDAVRRHGPVADDQSVVLLRRDAPAGGSGGPSAR